MNLLMEFVCQYQRNINYRRAIDDCSIPNNNTYGNVTIYKIVNVTNIYVDYM